MRLPGSFRFSAATSAGESSSGAAPKCTIAGPSSRAQELISEVSAVLRWGKNGCSNSHCRFDGLLSRATPITYQHANMIDTDGGYSPGLFGAGNFIDLREHANQLHKFILLVRCRVPIQAGIVAGHTPTCSRMARNTALGGLRGQQRATARKCRGVLFFFGDLETNLGRETFWSKLPLDFSMEWVETPFEESLSKPLTSGRYGRRAAAFHPLDFHLAADLGPRDVQPPRLRRERAIFCCIGRQFMENQCQGDG